MKIKSKKKITKEIITYELSKNFFLTVTIENSKIINEAFYTNLKEIGKKCTGIYPKYLKDKKTFYEQIKTTHYSDLFSEKNEKVLVQHNKLFDYITENGFDEENVVICDNGGHMCYNSKMKPISTMYIFDYCSGFKSKLRDDKIYNKIIEKLKKSPYTIKLESGDIPYYNREFSGQQGILRWSVRLSDKVYTKLYDECVKNLKKDDYLSCRLKDMIYCCQLWQTSELDIYKTNSLVIEWSNVKKQYDEE